VGELPTLEKGRIEPGDLPGSEKSKKYNHQKKWKAHKNTYNISIFFSIRVTGHQ